MAWFRVKFSGRRRSGLNAVRGVRNRPVRRVRVRAEAGTGARGRGVVRVHRYPEPIGPTRPGSALRPGPFPRRSPSLRSERGGPLDYYARSKGVFHDADEKVGRFLYDRLREVYGPQSQPVRISASAGTRARASGVAAPKRLSRSASALSLPAVARPAGVGPLRVLEQTGRAALEEPSVVPKTVKGAAEIAVGSIAALAEIPVQTVVGSKEGDPLRGVKLVGRIPGQIVRDAERRYGPLWEGTAAGERKFRRRIKREGAAAEVLDAATVATLASAGIGQAVGRSLRRRGLGPYRTGRPRLRVTGKKSRSQELSPNVFRAYAQRAEDAARAGRLPLVPSQAKKNRRLARRGEPVRGLVAREGEVVRRTRRGQNKSQRVEVARTQSRAYVGAKIEQQREIQQGFRREFASLSRAQRPAVFHVVQGMIDPTDRTLAVGGLKARRARIVDEIGPERARKSKEVRVIDRLIRDADEVFGGEAGKRLDALRRKAAARAVRLEELEASELAGVGVTRLTAEARRLRPQGDQLDVPFPQQRIEALDDAISDAARQRNEREVARLLADKDRTQAAYIDRVRAARSGEGLAEPAFISHQKRPRPGFSDFALGGARFARTPRRSQMKLLREGRADVSPEVVEQSLARTIKRRRQGKAISDQVQDAAVPITGKDIADAGFVREAGGRRVPLRTDELTIDQWRTLLERKGWDPRDYAFWNPGIARVRRQEADSRRAGADTDAEPTARDADLGEEQLLLGDEEAFQAMRDSTIPAPSGASAAEAAKRLERLAPEFRKQKGWVLLPKAAYDEIMEATKPSGSVGRTFEKLQGLQSRVLLGLSPSWLQIQIAGNALLTGIGVRGNVAAPVQAYMLWKRMPREVRDAVDEHLGVGVLRGHGERARYGSQAPAWLPDPVVNFTRFLKETAFFRKAGKWNPMNLVFAADDRATRAMKRTVLLDKARRDAYNRMGQNARGAMREVDAIDRLLRLPPKERIEASLRDMETLERFARHADNILGDYVTYTARERRVLKRGVMFYGFLRYSLRTLFYTLPVRHPVAASVAAKLGQLHNEEVKDLLGGDEAPWAYSRIFFGERGDLSSIDLSRANPVTNPLVEVATKGPRALAGLTSPLTLVASNQVYSTNLFTNRPFRVGGSAKERRDLPAFSLARLRIGADQAASAAFPYRAAKDFFWGDKTQSDDVVFPFHQAPIRYKTEEAQADERRRRRARGTGPDRLLQSVEPFVPRPDETPAQIRRIRRERTGVSGGSFPRPGGGSSGGFPKPRGGY